MYRAVQVEDVDTLKVIAAQERIVSCIPHWDSEAWAHLRSSVSMTILSQFVKDKRQWVSRERISVDNDGISSRPLQRM